MLTNGKEERQFLHAKDAAECLFILSKKYKELEKDRCYHIASFKWSKIIEQANIISEYYGPIRLINSKDYCCGRLGIFCFCQTDIFTWGINFMALEEGTMNLKEYVKNRLSHNRFVPGRTKISLQEVMFSEYEITESIDSLLSTYLVMGKKVNRFEQLWCKLLGCKYSIATNSGTSALLLAMIWLKFHKASEERGGSNSCCNLEHDSIGSGIEAFSC